MLRHLRRQVGYQTEEYNNLIADLESALEIEDLEKEVGFVLATKFHQTNLEQIIINRMTEKSVSHHKHEFLP